MLKSGKYIIAGAMALSVFAAPVFSQSAQLDQYVRDLRNSSGSVRQNAVMSLGSLKDPAALGSLRSLASDRDADVRAALCWALGQIQSSESSGILTGLLRDSDANVRVAAASALGNLNDKSAGPALVSALSDGDSRVKKAAAISIGRIGYEQAGSALTPLVSDGDADVRAAAVTAMNQINYKAPSSIMASSLSDSDSRVRAGSALTMGDGEYSPVARDLVAALGDSDMNVRKNSALSLGKLRDLNAIGPLADTMADPAPEVREAAAVALGNIGTPALPALRSGALSGNRVIVDAAFRGLGSAGTVAVDTLADLMTDTDLRKQAVVALGDTRAPQALPVILSAFTDGNIDVRNAAAEAAGKFGSGAVEPLTETSRSEEMLVRETVAKALGYIRTEESADLLIELLKDLEENVVIEASTSLSQLGPLARPKLLEALKSDDDMQRAGAVNALSLMGAESAPLLTEALNDSSSRVRAGAALGLGQMDNKESAARVAALLSSDNDPAVKQACAWTLARIGDPSMLNMLVIEKTRAAGKGQTALQRTLEETIRVLEGGN